MNPRKEIAGSIVLILFSMIFLAYTTRYPLGEWAEPGPAVFPLILGAVLLIFSLWQLIRDIRAAQTPDTKTERKPLLPLLLHLLRDEQGEAKVVRLTALLIAYLILIHWIGFFVSTFLLVFVSSRITEKKGWTGPIVLSCSVTFFCYLLFEVWLKLSFPRGVLF